MHSDYFGIPGIKGVLLHGKISAQRLKCKKILSVSKILQPTFWGKKTMRHREPYTVFNNVYCCPIRGIITLCMTEKKPRFRVVKR